MRAIMVLMLLVATPAWAASPFLSPAEVKPAAAAKAEVKPVEPAVTTVVMPPPGPAAMPAYMPAMPVMQPVSAEPKAPKKSAEELRAEREREEAELAERWSIEGQINGKVVVVTKATGLISYHEDGDKLDAHCSVRYPGVECRLPEPESKKGTEKVKTEAKKSSAKAKAESKKGPAKAKAESKKASVKDKAEPEHRSASRSSSDEGDTERKLAAARVELARLADANALLEAAVSALSSSPATSASSAGTTAAATPAALLEALRFAAGSVEGVRYRIDPIGAFSGLESGNYLLVRLVATQISGAEAAFGRSLLGSAAVGQHTVMILDRSKIMRVD